MLVTVNDVEALNEMIGGEKIGTDDCRVFGLRAGFGQYSHEPQIHWASPTHPAFQSAAYRRQRKTTFC